MIWLVMQRNVWSGIERWQTRRHNNSTKYLLHASMTTTSKKKKSFGELSQVCTQIVLKCLYLARIGRPDILWSVNKLARSITKWTKACDRRLNRLISYIHHACEYKQYCHVGNTAKQCRLGLFQDSDFAGDLEDSKSTSGGTLCVFFWEVIHLGMNRAHRCDGHKRHQSEGGEGRTIMRAACGHFDTSVCHT